MNLKQLLTDLNPFNKRESNLETPEVEIPTEESKEIVPQISKNAYGIGRIGKDGKEIMTDKYTEEQKLFIVNCIGCCMSPTEIGEEFKERYGIIISHPSSLVGTYKRTAKWKSMIDKISTKYLADIASVAGSHKRVRLDRAERIYDRAVKRRDLRYQAIAIEQQRKEFEKHEYNQISILQQQYINMSDEELIERQKWIAEKLKLGGKNGKSGISIEEGT